MGEGSWSSCVESRYVEDGMPLWLSQLSVLLLISAQVMIPGWCDQALHGSLCRAWSLLGILSLCLSLCLCLSLSLSLSVFLSLSLCSSPPLTCCLSKKSKIKKKIHGRKAFKNSNRFYVIKLLFLLCSVVLSFH